jgi:tRNA dimethylallyltransferase
LATTQAAEKAPELTVVVGPTASGKTALAVALAERSGGEVVSADSVQIYRRFDVGAGKPSSEELGRARHHLIDAVDPLEPMDAARFAKLADDCIADIVSRSKTPIVCGGTFLWIRALLFGLSPAPPADPGVRERHRALAEAEGREALHARLKEVDALAATRLAPNDFVRVSRALEVMELTGTPLSSWHEQHGFRERRYSARLVGVKRTPEELTERIEKRTRAMLDAGWVDEVRALIDGGYRDARAMGSVGYRQIAQAVDRGSIDREALERDIVRATRIFARRQRTWIRDEPVEWISGAEL